MKNEQLKNQFILNHGSIELVQDLNSFAYPSGSIERNSQNEQLHEHPRSNTHQGLTIVNKGVINVVNNHSSNDILVKEAAKREISHEIKIYKSGFEPREVNLPGSGMHNVSISSSENEQILEEDSNE